MKETKSRFCKISKILISTCRFLRLKKWVLQVRGEGGKRGSTRGRYKGGCGYKGGVQGGYKGEGLVQGGGCRCTSVQGRGAGEYKGKVCYILTSHTFLQVQDNLFSSTEWYVLQGSWEKMSFR